MGMFTTRKQREEKELLDMMKTFGMGVREDAKPVQSMGVKSEGGMDPGMVRDMQVIKETCFRILAFLQNTKEESSAELVQKKEVEDSFLLCGHCKKMVAVKNTTMEKRGKHIVQLGKCPECGQTAFRMVKKELE